MGDFNPSTTSLNRATSTDAVFKNLEVQMTKTVEKVLIDHTHRMVEVLRNRRNLGAGLGRWPRWGSNWTKMDKTRAQSNKSYAEWSKRKRKDGHYEIVNTATKKWAGKNYAYPLNLANGGPWWHKIETGTHRRLVLGPGGGLYSTQMPKGLSPWLKRKKEEMLDDVVTIYKQETGT